MTPDVIVGRSEMKLDCSVRTLYRMFQTGAFNVRDLPMKGKRKPNGHQKNVGNKLFGAVYMSESRSTQNLKTSLAILKETLLSVENTKVLLLHWWNVCQK